MTKTVEKIMHNGTEYKMPTGFAPGNAGTTGDVLKKTASGYERGTASGGITNDTTGTTTTVTKIWAGTEAEYNDLQSYDASTIYHIY